MSGRHKHKKSTAFKTVAICSSLPFALSCAYANAQEQQEQQEQKGAEASQQVLENVTVTGIRYSLEQALQTKRLAGQIKDAISSEDIGKLPDQNIAESLQRVTGVQISRDFGEGNGVAVRGLSQNRVEMNGQTVMGSNSESRSIQFNDLALDMFSGMEVIKSPTADMTEGALGATINLKTRRAFDSNGMRFSSTLKNEYVEDMDKNSPSGSLFFSNRWDTSYGEMGASVALTHSEVTKRRDTYELRWLEYGKMDVDGDGANDEVFVPKQLRAQNWEREQERTGITTSLQWRPNEVLEVYADASVNQFDTTTMSSTFIARGDRSKTVSDAVVSADGTMVSGYLDKAWVQSNGWEQISDRETQAFSAGFNYDHEAWKLSGSATKTNGEDNSPQLFLSMRNTSVSMDYLADGGNIADFNIYEGGTTVPVDLNSADTWTLNGAEVKDAYRLSESTEAKLDFDYFVDAGHLTSLETGVRVAERSAYRERMNAKGSFPEPLSDYPQIGLNDIGDELLEDFGGFPDFIAEDAGAFNSVMDELGFDRYDTTNDDNYQYDIVEDNTAAYVKANFEGELLQLPYTANIGARYVQTKVDSGGWSESDAGSAWIVTENDYNDLLPSANIMFEFKEDLYLRLAAAKVMARPDIVEMSSAIKYQSSVDKAVSGNPNLKPYRASQFDLSLEWYLSDSEYASAALFYKDVESFIMTGSQTIQVDEEGVLVDYELTIPENGEGGKIQGIELGVTKYMDFLPEAFSGLGVTANYTYSDSETPNEHVWTGEALPLEDLSKHSYNFITFYEYEGFAARLAYNWRDEFLYATSGHDGQPEFEKARGQLDFSTSYDILDGLTATFDAINLNDSNAERYSAFEERGNYLDSTGRRFLLGLRYKL